MWNFLFVLTVLSDKNKNKNNKILFVNLKCNDISRAIPQKAEFIEAGSYIEGYILNFCLIHLLAARSIHF